VRPEIFNKRGKVGYMVLDFFSLSTQRYKVFLITFLTRGAESEVMLLGGIRLPV
jgi:hypothetical protein